ncbi:unnamed protein product [Rhodiola kirilowii]
MLMEASSLQFLVGFSRIFKAPNSRISFCSIEASRTVKLDSGVKFQDIIEGEGVEAREGDIVEVNYVCRRSNGYFVFSTVDQFNGESKPVILPLDESQTIKGLKEVLVGMRAGGKRRALIPASVGYVNENLKPIPDEFGPRRSLMSHANEPLVFEGLYGPPVSMPLGYTQSSDTMPVWVTYFAKHCFERFNPQFQNSTSRVDKLLRVILRPAAPLNPKPTFAAASDSDGSLLKSLPVWPDPSGELSGIHCKIRHEFMEANASSIDVCLLGKAGVGFYSAYVVADKSLDKIKMESKTDITKMEAEPDLFIQIVPDKIKKTLSIVNSGIGMTREDLVNYLGTIARSVIKEFMKANAPAFLGRPASAFIPHMWLRTRLLCLGTIARSGFKEFMEANARKLDVCLAAKGRVGFYSAYAVADKVIVSSKHNDDEHQYVWEALAGGYFTVRRDYSDEVLVRGTKVTLYLKEDQLEYLEEKRLKDLIKKYSSSKDIYYPIFLWVEKTTEKKDEESKVEEVSHEWSLVNPKH